MNGVTAWLGCYFFLGLAFVAFIIEYRKKEPKGPLISIGLGSTLLAAILCVSALGGKWSDVNAFYLSTTIACLLFFGGLTGWALHYRNNR